MSLQSQNQCSDKEWNGKEKLPAGWRKEKCPFKSKSLFLGDGKVRHKLALFNMTLTLLNTPWRERKDSWRMEWSEGGQQHPM